MRICFIRGEKKVFQSDNAVDLLATITRLQDQIIGLQAKCERLERELSDTKENNELLEFQLLENNENMKHELEVCYITNSIELILLRRIFFFPNQLNGKC